MNLLGSEVGHVTGGIMSQSDNQTRPDIEQAKNRMTTKFGGKRELRKLQEHIWPGETFERMATGVYGGGLGLLVMTDKRPIFLNRRRGAGKNLEPRGPAPRYSPPEHTSAAAAVGCPITAGVDAAT